jgi:2-isopropylmalate synthase
MGLECGVSQGELARAVRQMTWLDSNKKPGKTPFGETTGSDAHEDVNLTAQADIAAVIKAVKKLGYELSDDDNAKVFKEFKRVSAKKPVGAKELEAIIATAALQVPPTYQ